MSTVSMNQVLRRVPYLLGGAASHHAPPMPRHALPALFLPLPATDGLVAAGCRAH